MGKTCMGIDYDKLKDGERELIAKIGLRALKLFGKENIDVTGLEMDLTATHTTNPLRLEDFLNADDSNFGHDIVGIQKNLDRATGEFDNFFWPRF